MKYLNKKIKKINAELAIKLINQIQKCIIIKL